ncbi:MAG: DUF5119 domain-containing protein [Bacteroidales bacterium]|nr:DUF5119 domain-containing protein [Bacteroidales bacterium]
MRVSRHILAALLLLTVTACQRRPLEMSSVSINLNLRIKLNVQVNGQYQELPEPEMMRVMFFNPETDNLITESYLPAKGGRITLPPGKYKYIGYNFDTESTLLRNDRNFNSIEAYTNEVPKSLKASMINAILYGKKTNTKADDDETEWAEAVEQMEENPVVYEPDHLFVSRKDVEILNIDGDQTIEADAETIIETWKITLRIKNAKYIASAKALITGQIASNFIGLPKEEGKTDTDVTLLFDMKAGSDSDDNDFLEGQFNTFGKNPAVESRLWLTIIIKTTGGETLEWHQDITEEYTTDMAHEEQIIQLEDEIEVPEPANPEGGGGGFQPGVDDWNEENVPIEI